MLAPGPSDSASLLKESFEGGAAWCALLVESRERWRGSLTRAAIEPNCDLIHMLPNCGLEDEEQGAGLVFHVNWDKAGVHLRHEALWDIRETLNTVC
jgi:hypothetical protein